MERRRLDQALTGLCQLGSYIASEGPWGPRDAKAEAGGQRPIGVEAESQRSGGQRSGSQRDQVRSPN